MNRCEGIISEHCSINVELLEWSQFLSTSMESKHPQHHYWDVIIGSDCLFFKDYHDALVQLLVQLLSATGKVVLFQPSRSHTMEMFLQKANAYFAIEIIEQYSNEVNCLLYNLVLT